MIEQKTPKTNVKDVKAKRFNLSLGRPINLLVQNPSKYTETVKIIKCGSSGVKPGALEFLPVNCTKVIKLRFLV